MPGIWFAPLPSLHPWHPSLPWTVLEGAFHFLSHFHPSYPFDEVLSPPVCSASLSVIFWTIYTPMDVIEVYRWCERSPESSSSSIFPGSPKVFLPLLWALLVLFCLLFRRTTWITWVYLVNPRQEPHPRVLNLMPFANFLCHGFRDYDVDIFGGIVILPPDCELVYENLCHYSTNHSHLAKISVNQNVTQWVRFNWIK